MSPGKTIQNRYRLLRMLGQGGMGSVYLARDSLHPERRTALKVLHPELRRLDQARLRQEFLTLAGLSHPHLVKVLDYGVVDPEGGECFFTYDLVPGKDIASWYRRRQPKDLLPIVLQICQALRYLHGRKLLHLDIKPSNLIAGARQGKPWVTLIDLGIHRRLGQRDAEKLGTLSFAAPELISGGSVDERSDLYSLGATLAHLLAGSTGAAVRPAAGLQPIIARLLAGDPADRFQSAADVEAEVLALLDAGGGRSIRPGTPLVGRTAEVDRIVQVFEDVCNGRKASGLVLISGEAGAGKTRLLGAVRPRLQVKGCTWIETACEDGSRPGLPIRDLVAQLLTLQGQKAGALDDLDELLLRQASLPDGPASPFALRRRLLELERYARLVTEAGPRHALVIEDLHLADGFTLDGIGYLTRSAMVLILGTLRPEEITGSPEEARLRDLLGGEGRTVIDIEPLGEKEVVELLCSTFDRCDPPRALVRDLLERTRGNAHALEQTIGMLIESGALSEVAGRLHLRRPLEELEQPQSLLQVHRQKLDRLSRRELVALRRLAFFNRAFAPDELPASWVGSGRAPAAWLADLTARGFLEKKNDRFAFRPPNLAALLRDRTPRLAERRIHADISAALDLNRSAPPEEHAYHVLAAGAELPLARRRSALSAAERTLETLAARQQLEMLEWLRDKTRGSVEPLSRVGWRLDSALAEAYERSGNHDGARRLLKRFLRLARGRDLRRGRKAPLTSELLRRLAALATNQGRPREALRLLARARQKALRGAAASRLESLRLSLEEARAHFAGGHLEQAGEIAARSLEASGRLRPRDAIAAAELRSRILNQLGAIHSSWSRFEEAYGFYLRSLKELKRKPQTVLAAGILCNLGNVATVTGRLPRSRRHHRQALEIARSLGALDLEALVQGNLAVEALLGWKLDAAAELIDQARKLAQRIGARRQESFALLLDGAFATRAGDLRRAGEVFAEVERRHHLDGDRYGVMNALLQAAYPAVFLGQFDRAQELLERGAALARELGWSRGALEAKLLAGMLYLHAGSPAEARRELAGALAEKDGHSLPLDAELRLHHGLALREIGELEAARREVRLALRGYVALGARPLEIASRAALERIDGMEGRSRSGRERRLQAWLGEPLPPVPMVLSTVEVARSLVTADGGATGSPARDGSKLRLSPALSRTLSRSLATARDHARRMGSAHLEWRVLDLQAQLAALDNAAGKSREYALAARRTAKTALDRLSADMKSRYARAEAWTRLHAAPISIQEPVPLQPASRRVSVKAETRMLTASTRPLDPLLGSSRKLEAALQLLERLAPTAIPVLVTGESGTGKEAACRRLHELSPRRAGPLVIESCATIPEPLFESEMFGHVRGAFTDAGSDRIGRIQQASGGSLYLAEVCDLPLVCQKKLIRVLQDRAVRPVGGSRAIPVDLRLIASTSKLIDDEVAAGRFLADLRDAVRGAEVRLPSLRERMEDLPALVEQVVAQHTRARPPAVRIEPDLLVELARRPWPGNIRELENTLRMLLLTGGERLSAADLKSRAPPAASEPAVLAPGVCGRLSYTEALDALDREYLADAMERSGGNAAQAAKLLGVNRRTVYKKLAKHGLKAR